VSEIVSAFLEIECIEQVSDTVPEFFASSIRCFSEQRLELCKEQFDWIEVRAVGWEKSNLCAGCTNYFFDLCGFVAGEIVENHNISLSKSWREDNRDICAETFTVHRTIKDERCR
jgi:hypothetical protein